MSVMLAYRDRLPVSPRPGVGRGLGNRWLKEVPDWTFPDWSGLGCDNQYTPVFRNEHHPTRVLKRC